MAISIDWATKIITVNKIDMTLVQSSPTEIYELDLNVFRLTLKDLEDDEEGMPFLDTHTHNTEVSLGGLTYARVIEMINGYTVTFEDGQYAVNLVGANSNVGDVVNVNQVSVRSANSAGLISSPAIEYSSFNGGVSIDTGSSYNGTIYPTGTPRQPVNNMTDALLIAEYRGFTTIYVINDIILDEGIDMSEMIFVGESKSKSLITIEDNADVTNCEFYDAEVAGILDGGNVLKNCLIGTLNYVNGYIEECVLKLGTITLGGSSEAHFLDCWSGVIGDQTPIIDMGGSGQGLALRNYNGGMKITNKTGTDDSINIDINSGHVIIDTTCTAGEIVIRGIGKLTDNSNGATVDVSDFVNPGTIADAVWNELITDHGVAGSTGEALQIMKGLSHNDIYIDQPVYDGYDNLTSARVRIYSDPASIGTADDVIATYTITSVSSGAGKFTYWQQVKV